MTGELSSLVLLLLSSCSLVPVGGQTCSLSAILQSTITVSAESVDGSTPAARVTWSTTVPPECRTSVRVDFRTGNHAGPVVATYNTTNTSQTEFIQTGLQCTTYYYITVVVTGPASGGIHPTKRSNLVQVLVGDIPTPVGVAAEATTDNTSISVSWQWSHQGVPMCINLVTIHYQPEKGSQMMYTVSNTPTAATTSGTLPNLQCNTKYTIWVRANGGQTDKGSVRKMLSIPSRAPPTPTGITAEFKNGSSIRISWQWTSSGPAPNCFNTTSVTYRPEGGSESSLQLSGPAATEANLTNLQNNTCYTITVVATAGGHRRESVARTVLFPLQDIPAPVVEKPKVTADNTSIIVSWEWSHEGVPMCVDLVRVNYQPEGGSLMMYTVGSTTTTNATLPNLQCNTEYTVAVYVESGSNKTGNMSVPRMVSMPARAPPTPTEVTPQFTSASSIRVTWQWTSSGPAPNCFNTTSVTYHPEGGSESSLQLRDPTATAANLTDLQNNTCNSTNSTITVVATAGRYEKKGITFLLLQGPRSLSATVLSSTSVHLTWVAPCHTQQYRVYYRGTCGGYVHNSSLNTSHQEYTVDELQADTNYSFTVNQTGFSGGEVFSTSPVYVRTFTAVPSGAPQSLDGMFVQATKVFLRWRKVSCIQQNGPITSYVVRYYATCGADGDIQRNMSVVTTNTTISGLIPYTEYAFQVAAVNVNGTGPFTKAIILRGHPHPPRLMAVTPVNSTTVTVSWSEVQCFNGSGAVTHYLVQYQSMCGGAVQNVTTNDTVQTVNILGLTPNSGYTFKVAAVNVSLNGTRLFSEPITLEGTGAPQLVRIAAVNSTTVTVSWTEVQCFNGSGPVTNYLVQYHSMCSQTMVFQSTLDQSSTTSVELRSSSEDLHWCTAVLVWGGQVH